MKGKSSDRKTNGTGYWQNNGRRWENLYGDMNDYELITSNPTLKTTPLNIGNKGVSPGR